MCTVSSIKQFCKRDPQLEEYTNHGTNSEAGGGGIEPIVLIKL